MQWLRKRTFDRESAVDLFDQVTGLTFIGFILGVIEWLTRNFAILDEVVLDSLFVF